MTDTKTADPTHFVSKIRVNGDRVTHPEPVFFVPDTGTPGATAELRGPTGVHTIPDSDVQVTDPATDPFGGRVGFKCPPLTVNGDYSLVVDQDGTETVYTITVTTVDDTPQEA